MFDIFFSNLPYLMKGAVQTIWLGLAGVGFGTVLGGIFKKFFYPGTDRIQEHVITRRNIKFFLLPRI